MPELEAKKEKKSKQHKVELGITVAILVALFGLALVLGNTNFSNDNQSAETNLSEDQDQLADGENEPEIPLEPPEDPFLEERRQVDEYRATVVAIQAAGEELPEYPFFVDAASLAARIDDPRASYFADFALKQFPAEIAASDQEEIRDFISKLEAIRDGDNTNWRIWPDSPE